MKRILGFSLLGVLCFLGILSLHACASTESKPIYANDRVLVFINQEYTYLLEEESVDFCWGNIDNINYNSNETLRRLTLCYAANLTTWEEINEITASLESLDFVEDAEKNAWDTSFRITVKEEYNNKFDAEEFTLNDFKWNGASSLEYIHYSKIYFHEVIVTLKTHSQQNVQQAINHFNSFSFVKVARAIIREYTIPYPAFAYDTVLVVLTQEYTQSKDIVLAPSDFSFTNIGSVVYLTTHPDNISGYPESNKPNYRHIVLINLVECSKPCVTRAVEHIVALPFVQSAEPNYIMTGSVD